MPLASLSAVLTLILGAAEYFYVLYCEIPSLKTEETTCPTILIHIYLQKSLKIPTSYNLSYNKCKDHEKMEQH